MAEISLLDLLNKTPEQIRKQISNPFEDKIDTARLSPSPDFPYALDNLNKSINSNLLTEVEVKPPGISPVDYLKAELLDRRSRSDLLPFGLEKSGPTVESTDFSDDPNLTPTFVSTRQPQPGSQLRSQRQFDAPVVDRSLGGFNEERDTIEDVYRDQLGLGPKKPKPVDKSLLHGISGERDTIEDVMADKRVYIPNAEEENFDDDDWLEASPSGFIVPKYEAITQIEKESIMEEISPNAGWGGSSKPVIRAVTTVEEIKDKMFATRSRSTFAGVGVLGQHEKDSIVRGNDGYEYVILSISQTNNGVHLRRVDTGLSSRTSYNKFFGVEDKVLEFDKGDTVNYYNPKTLRNEQYVVVGLNPAANNVQILMDGKKHFIRVTKLTLVSKAADKEDD